MDAPHTLDHVLARNVRRAAAAVEHAMARGAALAVAEYWRTFVRSRLHVPDAVAKRDLPTDADLDLVSALGAARGLWRDRGDTVRERNAVAWAARYPDPRVKHLGEGVTPSPRPGKRRLPRNRRRGIAFRGYGPGFWTQAEARMVRTEHAAHDTALALTGQAQHRRTKHGECDRHCQGCIADTLTVARAKAVDARLSRRERKHFQRMAHALARLLSGPDSVR